MEGNGFQLFINGRVVILTSWPASRYHNKIEWYRSKGYKVIYSKLYVTKKG